MGVLTKGRAGVCTARGGAVWTTSVGAALGILVKSWERVFRTDAAGAPGRHPAAGLCVGGSGPLPAPGGVVLPPCPSPADSTHEGPKARPRLPSPSPHQQEQASGTGHPVGPQPRCPAPGSSCGRQDRRWTPSKAPGQPGVGVRVPAPSARGGRSSLEPLPEDDGRGSGLGLRPQTGSAQAPECTAYLLILGPPVEVRFSIHVQKQQVTQEGDLGAQG